MPGISDIIKAVILIIIISICAIKLWNISLIYTDESSIKAEMQYHVTAERAEDKALPVRKIAAGVAAAGTGVADSVAAGAATGTVQGHLQEPVPQQVPMAWDISGFAYEPEPVRNLFIQDLQMEINSDITGWLTIPGTKIDYPVVRTEDNDYYLRRDIYKNKAQAGSLFADYRCARQFSGFNTIIYGHNMRNRSMFGDLRLYADAGFLEENRYGILFTGTKTYNLEIFAFMVVTSDDGQIYANPPSAEALIGYVKENARVYREPGQSTEKVLTLSTCAYEFEGARIVVLAGMSEW